VINEDTSLKWKYRTVWSYDEICSQRAWNSL